MGDTSTSVDEGAALNDSLSGAVLAHDSSSAAVRPWKIWLAVFGVAFALYAATSNRGVQWQDSGWQQYRIVTGQILHPAGLALVHPLHFSICRLAYHVLPLEPAHSTTLVSALFAAIAVANVFMVIRTICDRVVPAATGAMMLLLSHTFWENATQTESYSLVCAVLTCEWWCLARYFKTGDARILPVSMYVNGLGVACHLLVGLVTPVHAAVMLHAYRRGQLRFEAVVRSAFAWLIGTLPFTALVAGQYWQSGDLAGTITSALFGDFQKEVLNLRVDRNTFLLPPAYIIYNLPGLAIPLACIAAIRRGARGPRFTAILGIDSLILALFVARYSIVDQYTFFFPLYLALCILAGIGLDLVLHAARPFWRRTILAAAIGTALWTPLLYSAAAIVARSINFQRWMVGNKPYREGYWAFFTPWGFDKTYGQALNRALFPLAGRDGLVLTTDSSISHGILYDLALGRGGPEVTLEMMRVSDDPDEAARWRYRLWQYLDAGRPVVLVPYDRDLPITSVPDARWERRGDLYILVDVPGPRRG